MMVMMIGLPANSHPTHSHQVGICHHHDIFPPGGNTADGNLLGNHDDYDDDDVTDGNGDDGDDDDDDDGEGNFSEEL